MELEARIKHSNDFITVKLCLGIMDVSMQPEQGLNGVIYL